MKKILKISWLIIGIIAIIYSLNKDYKYIFTLLSVLICFSIIPFVILLKRNLRISKYLFKKRFFWLYPSIVFISVLLFSTSKYLMRGESPSLKATLFVFGISLLVGIVWGFKEYLKIKNDKKDNELVESVDLVNDEYDTEKSGILTLSQSKEVSFFEKNVEIFKVQTVEIKEIVVNLENKFFPTHFLIEFKNGKIYQFDSEFPYVWKNELLK
jgi:FlaA1/EpsC-like NDP-sugar epimerase